MILGRTGRNFAAGMSGGIAYVLDREGNFRQHCNPGMVDLDPLDADDVTFVRNLIARHVELTKSRLGQWALDQWASLVEENGRGFIKVMPRDYKRVLQTEASDRGEEGEGELEFVEVAARDQGERPT